MICHTGALWSLEMGHLLWLLVVEYRNMQPASCDSDVCPQCGLCSLYLREGRTVCSPVTRPSPPPPHPRLICACRSADEAQMGFIYSSIAGKQVHMSECTSRCAVSVGGFHRIYALKQRESCQWWLCWCGLAGRSGACPRSWWWARPAGKAQTALVGFKSGPQGGFANLETVALRGAP